MAPMMYLMRISVLIIGTVNCLSSQENLIRELLNESNYDDTLYPGIDNGQVTNVSIYLLFYGIHSINEENMDFSAEIFFQQRWEDQRLQHPVIPNLERLYLVPEYIKQVWRPTVYFSNEKTATKHTVPQENEVMYIYPNGTIIYNMRISVKFGCAMEFKLFPFDVQKCDIEIESYSYTDDDVQLSWDTPTIDVKNTELQHFTLNRNIRRSEYSDITKVGNFSSLSVHLLFERRPGHYILSMFIPCVFIVILSWISFLVDPRVVHGRLSLGSVTVLTMASHYATVQKRIPSVSYVMAVDVWMIFSQFIVFAVLIEFAYVYYVDVFPGKANAHAQKDYESVKTTQRDNQPDSRQTSFNDTIDTMSMSVRIDKNISENLYENVKEDIQTDTVNPVDKWSQWLFPGVFVLFVLIYCGAYGSLANNQN